MTTNQDQQLHEAALVHAARAQVLQAVGWLAARPLDERAAERMRQALARAGSVEVRSALRSLRGKPGRPQLTVLPGAGVESELGQAS